MTFYICDREKQQCYWKYAGVDKCINEYCNHTQDINHRKYKGSPITFKVIQTFDPREASLWEVPYIGMDDLHLRGFWHV